MLEFRNENYQAIPFSEIDEKKLTYSIKLRKSRRDTYSYIKRLKKLYSDFEIIPPLLRSQFPYLEEDIPSVISHHLQVVEAPRDDLSLIESLSYLRIYMAMGIPNLKIDMLELLLKYCNKKCSPMVIKEASTNVLNLTDMVPVEEFMNKGALHIFIRLIYVLDINDSENILLTLGNLAMESDQVRTLILHKEIIKLINTKTTAGSPDLMTKQAVLFLLMNLSSKLEGIDFWDCEVIIDLIFKLYQADDLENQNYFLITASNLCRRNELITVLLSKGILTCLKEGFDTDIDQNLLQSLNLLGSLCSGDDEDARQVINSECLIQLNYTLSHPNPSIREKACWAISNMVAGSFEHIDFLNDLKLLWRGLECLMDHNIHVKKESVHILYNFLNQFEFDSNVDILLSYISVNLNRDQEADFLDLMLDCCKLLLETSKKEIPEEFVKTECKHKIETLALHTNQSISGKATELLAVLNGLNIKASS